MGHAHHTLPLIYLEEARAEYWRTVVGRGSLESIEYIMAEITLRLHKRIHWPARLVVGLRVSKLGGKSFDMQFEIRDDAGDAAASGRTVQVMYDYAAGASTPIPADVRERIQAFEPGLSAGG
jgi:acyl-CoA thioester hydrolase